MIDLLRLVEAPATTLPYNDPVFPDRPLVLHAARPRDYDTGTPVLFVHHGVRAIGLPRSPRLAPLDEARPRGFQSAGISAVCKSAVRRKEAAKTERWLRSSA